MSVRKAFWAVLSFVVVATPGCGQVLGLDDYHPAMLCDDGVLDEAETDIDCGGPVCDKCDKGKKCDLNADCMSGSCANSVCTE
ncbi:MAG: hypothetical protein QM820_39940 [Minicystis sp.]